MPIEIRELVIKATLGEETQNTSNTGEGGNGEAPNEDAIVKACVERVLQIIKEKAER